MRDAQVSFVQVCSKEEVPASRAAQTEELLADLLFSQWLTKRKAAAKEIAECPRRAEDDAA